jgi:hypothetical protein
MLPWTSDRKEAHHVLLQMPAGTDGQKVLPAARAFARGEFQGHRYAMVLHEHQSTPHVHLIVRTEADDGRRLNPRKADLHRWRMRFAHELRQLGVEAAASRQRTRGNGRRADPLWERKASARAAALRDRAARASALGRSAEADELATRAAAVEPRRPTRQADSSARGAGVLSAARERWSAVAAALESSNDPADRALAKEARQYAQTTFDQRPAADRQIERAHERQPERGIQR